MLHSTNALCHRKGWFNEGWLNECLVAKRMKPDDSFLALSHPFGTKPPFSVTHSIYSVCMRTKCVKSHILQHFVGRKGLSVELNVGPHDSHGTFRRKKGG